jgi:hypothetical protein
MCLLKTIVMTTSDDHQKRADDTITCFHERGITCTDFEIHVGHDDSKRPDLWLPEFNTLIEMKTLAPQKREIKEARRIDQEMLEGKVSAYWLPTFHDRFGVHLRSARRKFRAFPTYHTAVLFYDLHTFIHAQTPEDLLRGEEYVTFGFPEDRPEQAVQVGGGYRKRQLRKDLNNEIGAVVFHTGQNTFRVFHNHFAEKLRQIERGIFALPEDEHFEYVDDRVNPQIIKLGGC